MPRELARASAKSGLVVGSKDTLAHVTRALGDMMPLRDVKHPYDALVLAGSDPPDVFIVDAKAVATDVDVVHWLEALERGSREARFVVLSDEATGLPAFVTRIGRMDAQGLRSLLVPEPVAPVAAPMAPVGPVTTPTGTAPAAANANEAGGPAQAVEELPPRAAGGSSR